MPPREDGLTAWKCRCTDDDTVGCEHVAGSIVIGPSCASYTTVPSDARDRGVAFAVDGSGTTPRIEVIARRRDGLSATAAVELVREGTAWRAVVPPFTTRGVDSVRIIVQNPTLDPTQIDEFHVNAGLPPPPRVVGTTLFAEHHSELTIAPGRERAEFWAPLPAMHASQVPVYVAVQTDPSDIRYRFVAHDDANWGVMFEFPPSDAAREVALGWRAVVLTRHVWPEERPRFYGGSPADAWLASTVVADARDDIVQEVARSIAPTDASALVKLEGLLAFTTTGLVPDEGVQPRLPSQLSSTTGSRVLRGRKRDAISCTGFAASITALGRALGLPTRYVTGYVVGESMQTHAIAEVCLGPELGWRRVEPQRDAVAVPEDYLVVVRVVHPRDEGPETLAEHRFAERGMPLYTVIENLGSADRLEYKVETAYFAGCPRCNNRAGRLAELTDVDLRRIDDVFLRANDSWIARRAALVSGADPKKVFADRLGVEDVRDLGALDRMLQ